jgi:hypothetical protein
MCALDANYHKRNCFLAQAGVKGRDEKRRITRFPCRFSFLEDFTRLFGLTYFGVCAGAE